MVDPLVLAGSAGVVGDRSGHAADLRPRGSRPQLKRTGAGKVLFRQMPTKGPERRSKIKRIEKLSKNNVCSNQASKPIVQNGEYPAITIATTCAIIIPEKKAIAGIIYK
jgi:hypothetical protein